jgi:hypothetical protein
MHSGKDYEVHEVDDEDVLKITVQIEIIHEIVVMVNVEKNRIQIQSQKLLQSRLLKTVQ